MRILLDTNIIIHRESNRIVNRDIGVLFYWLDKLHYSKCIHPITVDEINRHPHPEVINTMNVKLDNYQILKTIAPLQDNLVLVTKKFDTNDNDKNDTILLNEVYCKRVDFLISEDRKIHLKAKELGISDQVFRIDSFLEKVQSENPKFVDYKILSVKKEYFGNIDIKDSFFDSFREDYEGFDAWFNKKSDELAYICYDRTVLSAFLFIKLEDENENYLNISPTFSAKKRLKIGTFKVTSNGIKLGERFLKIVFDNAKQYKVEEIYVTIFDKRPEQLRLIALLEEWGFNYFGTKESSSGVENVYVRNFNKMANVLLPKSTFPWLSKESDVYIIPIRPEYHTELFPDSILRTEDPIDFIENEPHRNAISKIYVSHSYFRNLKSGDIIVFYRSGGIYKGVASTIGIVEDVISNISDFDELVRLCRKRSVLSEDELKEYWDINPKNRPFVVNFLYAYTFKKKMILKDMLDKKILPNMDSVRTINKIEREALKQLITLCGI